MEYVEVECNETRDVYIDDQKNGETNQTLRVSAGKHTFTLGGEQNYSPDSITKTIENTSVIEPQILKFEV